MSNNNNPYRLERCETGELCDFNGREVTYRGMTIRVFGFKHLCEHHKEIHKHQEAQKKAEEDAKKVIEDERLRRELQEYQWYNPPYKPQLPGRQRSDLSRGRCWDWIVVEGGYHYVRDQEYFESYTPLDKATVGGVRIAGIGSVELEVRTDGPARWMRDEFSDKTHTFILGNVLHIPTAYNNGFVANLVCEFTDVREEWRDEKVLQGYDATGEVVFSAERMYGNGIDDIYVRWGLCLPNELHGSPLADMVKQNPQLDVELTNTEWDTLLKAEIVESDVEDLETRDETVKSGDDDQESSDDFAPSEDEDLEAIDESVEMQDTQENIDATTEDLKRSAEDMESTPERLNHQGPDMNTDGDTGSPPTKRRRY